MSGHRIFTAPFASVYLLCVQKAERKGRTKAGVDEIIRWLTGYDPAGLDRQISARTDFETFFAQALALNPRAPLIKGVVCASKRSRIR